MWYAQLSVLEFEKKFVYRRVPFLPSETHKFNSGTKETAMNEEK